MSYSEDVPEPRRRYTARANPHLAGDTVPVTVRFPRSVLEVVDGLVGTRPGIETRTDALQDAAVVWVLLEEHDQHQAELDQPVAVP